MTITLTQEQLNYIFEFDKTKRLTVAVEQVLMEEAKEAIK